MVFSSTIFLCAFLPAVLLLYFLMPTIWLKNIVLLIFSLFFYAWGEPTYIVLMVASILVNYVFGLLIHIFQRKGWSGKFFLFLSVIANLGMLFYFKYFSFVISTAVNILGAEWTIPEIALPIGISFYTFQGMSYVIDVYREKGKSGEEPLVQKNIFKLALYISMFPQLIAGPIVRYSDINKALTKRTHSFEKFASGVEIFIIGLTKKVVFANILGAAADHIIAGGFTQIGVPHAWLSALLYMLQIFYDFCGYSEMAIGLGRIFGFEFCKNFDYPYISRSITEFWRRWHISLSTWFRDYLYIPLGGNRRGNVYFNLSMVFIATGIWHGADWSFILWGLWHGLFMLIERLIKKKNISIPCPKIISSVMGWVYTMSVVFFGWVVFRMADLQKSVDYFKAMFGVTTPEFIPYNINWYLDNRTLFILAAAIFCCIPWKQIVESIVPAVKKVWDSLAFIIVKRAALVCLLIICFILITNSTYNPFIYFRF